MKFSYVATACRISLDQYHWIYVGVVLSASGEEMLAIPMHRKPTKLSGA